MVLNNLKNELILTIDGCMVQKNPQPEIAKIFAQIFNQGILLLLKDFWNNKHNDLSVKIFLFKN